MREDFDSVNTQIDPSLIRQQAQAAANTEQFTQAISVPVTGAVTALNGIQGPVDVIAGSHINVSVGAATVSISTTGYGGLAILNAAANVTDSAVVAGAAYVQVDFQAVIDKLNALLGSLRTAGII